MLSVILVIHSFNVNSCNFHASRANPSRSFVQAASWMPQKSDEAIAYLQWIFQNCWNGARCDTSSEPTVDTLSSSCSLQSEVRKFHSRCAVAESLIG